MRGREQQMNGKRKIQEHTKMEEEQDVKGEEEGETRIKGDKGNARTKQE